MPLFFHCMSDCPDTLKNYFTPTKLAVWVRNWQQNDVSAGCMYQVIWFTEMPRWQTCKVFVEFVYTCIIHDHSNLLKHRLCLCSITDLILTLILLTWRIWWASDNASRWQVGFNLVFKGLSQLDSLSLLLPLPGITTWIKEGCHSKRRVWGANVM